jgi:hypothetical protein
VSAVVTTFAERHQVLEHMVRVVAINVMNLKPMHILIPCTTVPTSKAISLPGSLPLPLVVGSTPGMTDTASHILVLRLTHSTYYPQFPTLKAETI